MTLTLVKSPAVWSIPSSEAACVEAELYLQLATQHLNQIESKTRFTVVENKYCTHQLTLTHSSANSLPVLVDTTTVVPAPQVIPYLKNNFHDFDASLPVEIRPDLATYRIALDKLFVAIEYLNTVDNSVDSVYAKDANWFVRKLLLARHTADVEKLANAAGIHTREDALLAVSRVLHIFALKMETADYLFGAISSIDIGLAAAVLVLTYSSSLTASLVYNYFPALAASAHRIAAASELPSYTATPDLQAVSRSNVTKVNALIQKSRLPLGCVDLNTGTCIDSVDGDAFTADECSSPVTDYAEAAACAACKSQRKERVPVVTAAVGERYKSVITDKFSLACVAGLFGYYLAIKASRK